MWDLSLLPIVPGLRLAAPRDATSLRELLRKAVTVTDGPTVLRFPKASVGPSIPALSRSGNTDVLYRWGRRDVLLVAVGPLAVPCLDAASDLRWRGIGTTVVDPRWIAPLDTSLTALATAYRLVVTVEDNTTVSGLGARLAHAIGDERGDTKVCGLALPAAFLPHDNRKALLQEHGLDAPSIITTVLNQLGAPNPPQSLCQRSQQRPSDRSVRR
jgi:1-deoxy-D-xylulose-5-phosphate synthase